MKLYVCYGTWTLGRPVHRHPCGEAHEALANAGYHPRVIRARSLGFLPGFINRRVRYRRDAKRLTGSYRVPVLVLDDRSVIAGGREIVAWARENPAVVVGLADADVQVSRSGSTMPSPDLLAPELARVLDPALPELADLDELRNLVTPEAIINGGPSDAADRPPLTTELLTRWEERGAVWRVAQLDDAHVEVELCTCSGEPVDRLASDDLAVVDFVRRRPHQDH